VSTVILRLSDVLVATPRTRIIRLDLDPHGFAFAAGQAVAVGLQGRTRQPYSIANSPGQAARDRMLELLVQVEDDDVTNPHLERATPGTAVELEGPFGAFGLPPGHREHDLLFVAGGTGIAPLRSMIWDLLDRASGHRMTLVYSARSPDEFAYGTELRGLAAGGRLDLHLTVTRLAGREWTGWRGRIDRRLVIRALHTPETRCFICGPQALVTATTTLLREAGVSDDWIQGEY
jgi:ferredoxin-NADP reductase